MLFLISDGPRNQSEAAAVAKSRQIAQRVDWPCDVRRIYSETNLGCKRRISSGITTAFRSVDRLIVLEDDCLAHRDFFPYCDALLDRFADEQDVMAITGNNFQHGQRRTHASYYFSIYPHCWGWATWRRAWQYYDGQLRHWAHARRTGVLEQLFDCREQQDYWTRIFNACHRGQLDSWAYPWTLSCWLNGGLTAIPRVNLVRNIGFGDAATHTRKSRPAWSPETESLGPLVHPRNIAANVDADRYTDQVMFSGPVRGNMFKRIRRKLGITSRRRAA
jgi:hypothetical protein